MAWPAGRGLDEMTPRDPLDLSPQEVSLSTDSWLSAPPAVVGFFSVAPGVSLAV